MAGRRIIRIADPVPEAARLFREFHREIRQQRGSVRLAIPGGSALTVLEKHIEPEAWQRTLLTWVDERCVPFNHPESNRGEAHRRHILGAVPCVELPLYLDGESGAEACLRVGTVLWDSFEDALDLLLLGMGEDGHIASLFPGRAWSIHSALAHVVEDSPKPPLQRITLSLPMLCTASKALLLVQGEAKRDALERLLLGDPRSPASALPNLVVVTDIQAR